MAKDWHEFRDPVHGFVVLNDLERAVVDSRPFQRLRRIKQLATTHLVYPGAVHTRFEHGLGTLEMASRAFDVLVWKGGSDFLAAMSWKSQEEAMRARQTLRLGALLHDVGHPPFSHAPEEDLMPDGSRHETFTEKIIQESEIRQIVNSSSLFALDLNEITYVAVGPKGSKPPTNVATRFLGELVFGDLGVDRIDYLARDSLHLGVQYGKFDYSRLLNTLTFSPSDQTGDPLLAIEEGGIHSAEGLFLARRFMFLQVYLHDVRVLYDIHLVQFIREYLQPAGKLPDVVDAYLDLDDTRIEAAMESADGILGELAEPFRSRSTFGLAFELYPQDRYIDSEIFEQVTKKLEEEFGHDVIASEPKGGGLSVKEGDIPIVGTRPGDILEFSEFTRQLVASPIWLGRIYAKKDKRPEVTKRCAEIVAECKLAAQEGDTNG